MHSSKTKGLQMSSILPLYPVPLLQTWQTDEQNVRMQ